MKFGLVIAGYDPTGSAGIILDSFTFRILEVYPLTVITVLTVQTPDKVVAVEKIGSDYVKTLIDNILSCFNIDVVKIGVLGDAEIANIVADRISVLDCPIVVDPVIRAGDGTLLTDPETLRVIEDKIIPRATIVTPNVHEAEILAGMEIRSIDDMKTAAEMIARKYGIEHVLVKGGHLMRESENVTDVLYDKGSFMTITVRRLKVKDVHGTGCILSSAIAAYLAQGLDVPSAVKEAKKIVELAMEFSIDLDYKRNLANVYAIVELQLERYNVIEKLKQAIELLRQSSEYVVDLIPEVRSNIAYALPAEYVRGIQDVAGIPGRITVVDGKITCFSEPKFGASWHVGRAVLAFMKHFPNYRACMNIRYSEDILEIAKDLGFRIVSFDRSEEPEDVKRIEGLSIPWGIERALKNVKEPPDIVYDKGAWGKEPQIRVFGKDPIDVVYKVIRIGIEYLRRKEESTKS
ncbi:MAG: bifunctional hydroxymethylpyrimidine kinase/phosphomethylpyrimidine kinase [Crenarchaeota archaeon]|nr:bifunctional hydroxymethylpyrimidine kinase/phosphomethylpyrimidine kinase [Thermoproteota archaeon]